MLEKSKQVSTKLLREPSLYVVVVLLVFISILAIYKTGESGSWAIIGSVVTAALAYATQSAVLGERIKERRKILGMLQKNCRKSAELVSLRLADTRPVTAASRLITY